MSFILALDQGTTSSRAIVFDRDGAIRAVAQKEFTQIFPQAGWVEHDPPAIWASQIRVAVEGPGGAPGRPQALPPLGITHQRQTPALLGPETGPPGHKALSSPDRPTPAYFGGPDA